MCVRDGEILQGSLIPFDARPAEKERESPLAAHRILVSLNICFLRGTSPLWGGRDTVDLPSTRFNRSITSQTFFLRFSLTWYCWELAVALTVCYCLMVQMESNSIFLLCVSQQYWEHNLGQRHFWLNLQQKPISNNIVSMKSVTCSCWPLVMLWSRGGGRNRGRSRLWITGTRRLWLTEGEEKGEWEGRAKGRD